MSFLMHAPYQGCLDHRYPVKNDTVTFNTSVRESAAGLQQVAEELGYKPLLTRSPLKVSPNQ